MTWSAAFPGAVVRVLRTAAGRRALQVGLLVGGLFVLGFLCGEQAHAADGVEALPGRTIGQLVKAPTEPRATETGAATATGTDTATGEDTAAAKGSARRPVASEPGRSSGPLTDVIPRPADDDKVLRPVVENVVGTVGDRVVQPVGDLVETVTTGLTGTVGIPPLTELPELPTYPEFPEFPKFPASPSWPTLPTVPGVPTVPGLPEVPVRTLPAPVTSMPLPQHQSAGDAATKPADVEGSVGGGAGYGPRFADDGTVTEAAAHTSAHRGTPTAQAPVHRAPAEDPSGALGGRSAVDNGSSRHGDAHAITAHHRTPVRLVPGAAAGVDVAGTRDRHRDIPVFPG
ncbi:hypothetical protein AB0D34_29210 [Streptomyces sp. NPDC048420]|uniref:hypothetical protein n=1 Tax=Streptomyces sp. NPDC048420 TaxID=3155755 RepID=UPI00343A82F3